MKRTGRILITFAAVLLMAVSIKTVYAAETETTAETTAETAAETKPVYKNEFVKKDGVYYYYQKNGKKYTKSGFKKIDGKYYYFQKKGKLYTKKGLKKIKGATYCFTKKHYIVTSAAVKTKGVLHVYGKNGKMLKNKLPFKLDGKYYRIDKKGVAEKISATQAEASRLAWVFINKYTKKSDSNKTKFRKCFNRMESANYRPGYIKRSALSGKDWPYKIVVKVLRNRNRWTHNCYGFACTIASLAKELGYTPYVCVLKQDHAVVQINGKYYDNMGARFGASSPAIKGWKIYKKYKF